MLGTYNTNIMGALDTRVEASLNYIFMKRDSFRGFFNKRVFALEPPESILMSKKEIGGHYETCSKWQAIMDKQYSGNI